ncbi:MAG: BTAD domain-containing putative transcriptional regulator [Gemmatimonadaceae bacterium]
MTAPSDTAIPHLHRLRTFGTLALLDAGEGLAGNRGSQRRRLALLAVLAAAGDRGRGRDELLLLFWPDATQERARHSLEQLMYALRLALGKEIFAGANPVRLNSAVISSDVGDFNAALARGDSQAAVEHYTGPFLEGFYLAEAPEFEQWMTAERAQLQQRYSSALQRLARRADEAGQHAAAVRWWRKLSEADPVTATSAAGLMRALMNAGDHAAALQHAERYESVVARELGTGVGPAVTELVAEARTRSKTQPVAAARPPLPISTKPDSRDTAHSQSDARASAAVGSPVAYALVHRSPRRRWRLYAVTAAAIVVVAALAVWSRASARAPVGTQEAQPSIAVLPFVNVGENAGDAAIVDGLTEEMIAVLARIPGLRVISRTSAFAFKDSDAGVRRIADSLGVSNVLEGAVQKVGSQLRVQVRLIDARDGSTRWSETYDRQLRDVFAVQSDIAGAVARELDLRLSPGAVARMRRGTTRNVVAYELYLRGSDRTLLRSDSAQRIAFDYFRQAVALDSTFAAAWAGLARMYSARRLVTTSAAQRQRDTDIALAYAKKAVALDDSLSEAHATLGVLEMGRFNFAAGERHLKRAIEVDPAGTLAHEWLVTLYLWKEEPALALSHGKRALELDPLSPYAHAEMARALIGNDRCDEALSHLDRIAGLKPPLGRAAVLTALCYAHKQMWPKAVSALRPQVERGGPQAGPLLGYVHARSGNRAEASRLEAEFLDAARRGEAAGFKVALVRAGFRDFEQAIVWLDRAVSDGSLSGVAGNPVNAAIMGPVFADLRAHPGFARIRERLGLQKR